MKAKRDFSLPQAIRMIEFSVPIKLFSGCRVPVTGWIFRDNFRYRYDKNKITVEPSNSFPFVSENFSDFSYKAHILPLVNP